MRSIRLAKQPKQSKSKQQLSIDKTLLYAKQFFDLYFDIFLNHEKKARKKFDSLVSEISKFADMDISRIFLITLSLTTMVAKLTTCDRIQYLTGTDLDSLKNKLVLEYLQIFSDNHINLKDIAEKL